MLHLLFAPLVIFCVRGLFCHCSTFLLFCQQTSAYLSDKYATFFRAISVSPKKPLRERTGRRPSGGVHSAPPQGGLPEWSTRSATVGAPFANISGGAASDKHCPPRARTVGSAYRVPSCTEAALRWVLPLRGNLLRGSPKKCSVTVTNHTPSLRNATFSLSRFYLTLMPRRCSTSIDEPEGKNEHG